MLRMLLALTPVLGAMPALAAGPPPAVAAAAPVQAEPIEGRLANGFRYIVDSSGPGDEVEIRLVVRAGSRDQRDGELEYAHLLEHVVAFTKSPEGRESRDAYRDLGLAQGQVNASTGPFETIYMISIRGDAKARTPQVIAQLADNIMRPVIDDALVKREAAAVLAEGRESQALLDRLDLQASAFFGDAGRRLTSTQLKTNFANLSPSGVQAFYDREYLPDRMTLVIVGDIDSAATVAAIQSRFGSGGALGTDASKDGARRLWIKGQATRVARIVAGDASPGGDSIRLQSYRMHLPDSAEARLEPEALAIAAIADRIFAARAAALVQREGSPFRDLQLVGVEWLDTVSDAAFVTTILPKAGHIEAAVQIAEGLLASVAREGFSTAEVERAKAELIKGRETPPDIAERLQAYVEGLVRLRWTVPVAPAHLELIRTATPASINARVHRWLAGAPEFVSLSAPAPERIAGYDEARIAKLFDLRRLPRAAAWEEREAAKFRFAPLGKPLPCEWERIYAGRYTQYRLPCANTGLVFGPREPQPGEAQPRVHIAGVIPLGSANLPGNLRADAEAAALFFGQYGHWGGIDRFGRRTLLSASGITLGLAVDQGKVTVQGSAAPDREAELLRLIRELVRFPTASEAALDDYRADRLEGQLGDVSSGSDPDLGAMAHAFRLLVRDGRGFSWAVAGDYDTDEIKRGLALVPGPDTLQREVDPSSGAEAGKGALPPADADRSVATVRMTLKAPFAYQERLQPNFSAASTILGDRLFDRLRNVELGVYSVQGSVVQRPGSPSRIIEIRFKCDPARGEELIRAAREEVTRLAKVGPSDAEIAAQRVHPLVGSWKWPQVWASRIAEASAVGVDMGAIDVAPLEITAESVRNLVAEPHTTAKWVVEIDEGGP